MARETDVPYFVYPHGSLDRTLRSAFALKHLKKMLDRGIIELREPQESHSAASGS